MNYPKYNLTSNTEDSHQTNPGWLVYFVRYKQPVSSFNTSSSSKKTSNLYDTENLMVRNDCTDIQINNSKNSFAKTCSLTMKVTDVNYQSALAPGDWVVIWMSNDQSKIDEISSKLSLNSDFKNDLCNWSSGLKFIGRVLRVTTNFYSSPSGKKTVTQNIQCQSFLELANSVYFTYELLINKDIVNLFEEGSLAIASQRARKSFKELNEKLDGYFSEIRGTSSPDDMVLQLFLFLLGIDNQDTINQTTGLRGSFFDSIYLPKQVSKILNKKSSKNKNVSYADKVWQIYNFYGGIQTYEPKNSGKPWENFTPKMQKTFLNYSVNSNDSSGQSGQSGKTENIPQQKYNVIWRTPDRTEGEIRMKMPLWQNVSIWNILNQFSHSTLNEMFTSLRINSENCICPNLTIREKPFSTGLYNYFTLGVINEGIAKKAAFSNESASKEDESINTQTNLKNVETAQNKNSKNDQNFNVVKTYYGNLPRWVIDDSLINSMSVSYDESERINFVQIYPNSSDAMGGITAPDRVIKYDAQAISSIGDFKDIKRNGLRADITEDPFYLIEQKPNQSSEFRLSIWAKKRADWLFNGHLKLNASVSLQGVVEPISEGDNVQIKGILYHIESVEHSCSITTNGLKSFRTVLKLSNGIVANSLNTKDSIPLYMSNLSSSSDSLGAQNSLIPSLSFEDSKKE